MTYQVRYKHSDATSIRGARIYSTHPTATAARVVRDSLQARQAKKHPELKRDWFVTDEAGNSCDFYPLESN